jgi:hypothetical protein
MHKELVGEQQPTHNLSMILKSLLGTQPGKEEAYNIWE